MTAIQQSGPEASPSDQLEMRVSADPAWFPSLRLVAADLATRTDFDLDAVSDLRMAIDEACAELLGAARPDAVLVCRFAVEREGITVTATVPASCGATVSREGFGWRILTTLADEVEVLDSGEPDGAGPSLGLRLRKLRRVIPE